MPNSNWKSAVHGARRNLTDTPGRLNADPSDIGDTGASVVPAVQFNVDDGVGSAASAASAAHKGPRLTTLVSFRLADGAPPDASLIADANGDLFSTTFGGGADSDGTVFEIARTEGGYARAPTTLVSFTGADGANSNAALLSDARGDLFGTTEEGGPMATARCSRSSRTRAATPARRPPSSASRAPMEASHSAA